MSSTCSHAQGLCAFELAEMRKPLRDLKCLIRASPGVAPEMTSRMRDERAAEVLSIPGLGIQVGLPRQDVSSATASTSAHGTRAALREASSLGDGCGRHADNTSPETVVSHRGYREPCRLLGSSIRRDRNEPSAVARCGPESGRLREGVEYSNRILDKTANLPVENLIEATAVGFTSRPVRRSPRPTSHFLSSPRRAGQSASAQREASFACSARFRPRIEDVPRQKPARSGCACSRGHVTIG